MHYKIIGGRHCLYYGWQMCCDVLSSNYVIDVGNCQWQTDLLVPGSSAFVPLKHAHALLENLILQSSYNLYKFLHWLHEHLQQDCKQSGWNLWVAQVDGHPQDIFRFNVATAMSFVQLSALWSTSAGRTSQSEVPYFASWLDNSRTSEHRQRIQRSKVLSSLQQPLKLCKARWNS